MSRIEKILRAMIDGTSYSESPQSRIEAILLAIKNNTSYSDLPQSRIEEILLAIKNETSYSEESMSRIEEILLAKLNGEEYTKLPESRIEELLIEWLIATAYKELEGVPPLTFIANGQYLIDWRIWGNVGGVGDKSANLINIKTDIIGLAFGGTTGSNPVVNLADASQYKGFWIPCESGTRYTLSRGAATNNRFSLGFTATKGSSASLLSFTTPLDTDALSITAIAPEGANYVCAYLTNVGDTIDDELRLMLQAGDMLYNYEPYGYRIPIMIKQDGSGRGVNVYVPEPLGLGDSYGKSDSHRELLTYNGENKFYVYTQVQPEKVYVKYKGG